MHLLKSDFNTHFSNLFQFYTSVSILQKLLLYPSPRYKTYLLIMNPKTPQNLLTCLDICSAGWGSWRETSINGSVFTFPSVSMTYCTPDDKAVAMCPAFLTGQLLPQYFFPVFKLPVFLLAFLNFGKQFPAGFLSRFRHG